MNINGINDDSTAVYGTAAANALLFWLEGAIFKLNLAFP
jgi:hypothetical protein